MMLPMAIPTPVLAGAGDTGWKSPTSTNSPNEWTNPGNAYDGVNDTWATTDDDDDEQGYCDFNFGDLSGTVITGIEVAVEVCSEDCDGCDLYVSLSWNNGSDYSNEKKIDLNCTEDTVYNLGGDGEFWGRHNWEPDEFTNNNFVASG